MIIVGKYHWAQELAGPCFASPAAYPLRSAYVPWMRPIVRGECPFRILSVVEHTVADLDLQRACLASGFMSRRVTSFRMTPPPFSLHLFKLNYKDLARRLTEIGFS